MRDNASPWLKTVQLRQESDVQFGEQVQRDNVRGSQVAREEVFFLDGNEVFDLVSFNERERQPPVENRSCSQCYFLSSNSFTSLL